MAAWGHPSPRAPARLVDTYYELSLRGTPGTRLGPYEIAAQIGEGGMGEVYRATDTKLDRDVAIKVLPESLAGDPGRIARSQREASVALLENPHNLVASARINPPILTPTAARVAFRVTLQASNPSSERPCAGELARRASRYST